MEFPIIATKYDHVNIFINQLAPIVVNEFVKRVNNGERGTLPSVCLAQAATESGYNLNATTLFGIKGDDIILDTTEYINGEYINLKDGFKLYPSISASVQGYYDLMQWNNYNDATFPDATTVDEQVNGLTNDNGYKYATSPTYADTVKSVINDFGLTVFDDYAMSCIAGQVEIPIVTEYNSGDKVTVITDSANCVYDTNGTYCRVWHSEYDVIDCNDDGVCVGVDGEVFARLPYAAVKKVGD